MSMIKKITGKNSLPVPDIGLFRTVHLSKGMSRRVFCVSSFSLFLAAVTPAFANKSSVSIEVPAGSKTGDTLTIKLNVAHNGNNFIHHTEWVHVKVNGKEIRRWDFKWNHLPEAGNFTVEVPYVMDTQLQIEARSNCNIHGSMGLAKAIVDIIRD